MFFSILWAVFLAHPYGRASWFIWITLNIGPVEQLSTKTNHTEQSLKTVWRKSIVTCIEKLLAQFQKINKFLIMTQVKLNNIQDQYIFNETENVCITNVSIFPHLKWFYMVLWYSEAGTPLSVFDFGIYRSVNICLSQFSTI